MTYAQRLVEVEQELAEQMAENARLRAKLRAALGWDAPPAFFWLGREAEPPRVTFPPPPPIPSPEVR